MGPKLIRICPEAVGSPYLGIVSNLFGLLQKQSLASHVCPATQPAYNFAHSNVFMNIPHPAGLASLTCLAPCSHTASSPNHCSGNLVHSPWGFLVAIPSLTYAVAFHGLSFTSQLPAFYSHSISPTNTMGCLIFQGVGHGL